MNISRVITLAIVCIAWFTCCDAHAQEISFATSPAMQVTTPIPQRVATGNDFDGDGMSEILWYNPATSQVRYWNMVEDASHLMHQGAVHTFGVTPGYFVGATGDFNHDGFTDLLLTSAARDLVLWTNDRRGNFISSSLGTYPAGWVLVGGGDVDGDGTDDLLWYNADGCQFGWWLIRDGVRVGSRTVSVTCGYKPLSIGYYNLSNRISIIWTGPGYDLWAWDSNGAGFVASALTTLTATPYVFGGGHQGAAMSMIQGNGTPSYLERSFSIGNQQTSRTVNGAGSGFAQAGITAAGFMTINRGIDRTGVMYLHGATGLEVCPPDDQNVTSPQPTAAPPNSCMVFPYENGWFVVGAASATGSP